MITAEIERECRIGRAMQWTDLTREEAEAQVDAQLAIEEANARVYLGLMQAIRKVRAAA